MVRTVYPFLIGVGYTYSITMFSFNNKLLKSMSKLNIASTTYRFYLIVLTSKVCTGVLRKYVYTIQEAINKPYKFSFTTLAYLRRKRNTKIWAMSAITVRSQIYCWSNSYFQQMLLKKVV